MQVNKDKYAALVQQRTCTSIYTRFRSLKYYTYHVHFIFVVKNAIIPHNIEYVTNEKMIKKNHMG